MIKSVRELRASTKEILKSVDRGEEVVITKRGKACAKIVPIGKIKEKPEKDELFGIWKDNPQVKSVKRTVDELRKGRHAR